MKANKPNKEQCLDFLKTYYGMYPYEDHISRGSYLFYYWIEQRFEPSLIEECKQILREEKLPGLKDGD